METALGPKPDSRNFKLHIKFLLHNGLTLYLNMSIEITLSNWKRFLDSSETYTSLWKHDTKQHKKMEALSILAG